MSEVEEETERSPYGICPLTEPDSIRVIHLHPGSRTEELQCTLAAVRLGQDPSYEALSYYWGPPVFDKFITCVPAAAAGVVPSTSMAITGTLYDALIHIREKETERTLWIDQICINQADSGERSSQVAMMNRIYTSTWRASVWLGERIPGITQFLLEICNAMGQLHKDGHLQLAPTTAPSSHLAFSKVPLREMTEEFRGKYDLPALRDPRWAWLHGIFTAPWLSRVWIIQEVALPPLVDVLYANGAAPWDDFTGMMAFIESLEVPGIKSLALRPWQSRFKALSARRKLTQERDLQTMDELLSQHRGAEATDPRDHIWGLMGLAAECDWIPQPDYATATATSVFTGAAMAAIIDGNLDILVLCGDPAQPDRPEGLPSWVPDFGHASGPHSLTGKGGLEFMRPSRPLAIETLGNFRASGPLPASPQRALIPVSVCGSNGLLRIPGVLIGEIEEVTAGSAAMETISTHRHDKLKTRAAIISASLAIIWENLRESMRIATSQLAWNRIARNIAAQTSVYKPTREGIEHALLRTYLEGETGEALEEFRQAYKLDQLLTTIWRLLTLGQGSFWLPLDLAIGLIMAMGVMAVWPLLRLLGYPSFWSMTRYIDRIQVSAERELFRSKEDLIGLAPRWAVPGDQIFILRGGRVPMLLRQDVNGYRFIGEAYVHGAMHGEMFDVDKCKLLHIR